MKRCGKGGRLAASGGCAIVARGGRWVLPVLSAAVFVFVLCCALGYRQLSDGRHRRALDRILGMDEEAFVASHGLAAGAALRHDASSVLHFMLGRVIRLAHVRGGADVTRRLQWAGAPMQPDEFVALRWLAGGVFATLSLLGAAAAGWPMLGVPLCCLGAVAGHTIPDMWMGAAIRRRRATLQRELPYFLDFLAMAAQAGLTVAQAIAEVTQELPGLLSDAFAQAQTEQGMGQWDEHALSGLADRLGDPDLRAVVDALVRAGRFGAATAGALRELAGGVRKQRREAAQEHANRAGAAIVLPVALFIMPAVVLILGYPSLVLVGAAFGRP